MNISYLLAYVNRNFKIFRPRRSPLRSPVAYQVPNGHHRMAPDHARAGESHHLPDPLAHLRLVAVYGAVLAGGFLDPEGAIGKPFFSVLP